MAHLKDKARERAVDPAIEPRVEAALSRLASVAGEEEARRIWRNLRIAWAGSDRELPILRFEERVEEILAHASKGGRE